MAHHSRGRENHSLKIAGVRLLGRAFLSQQVGTNTECGKHDGQRAAKTYRGSRRRLRQLKPRGNGSAELWLLIGWVAFLLLVVLPWVIRQGR